MAEPGGENDRDKAGKWLVAHHGGSILRIGGVEDLDRWQAALTDLVLPAKLPDGRSFARRAGRDRPEPSVAEIATYPETRAAERALRDLMRVDLTRGEVPNVIVLVLRPRGRLRVSDHAERPSPDGLTELIGRWRVVEVWNVPAEPVLATADPRMMPWGPPRQAELEPAVGVRNAVARRAARSGGPGGTPDLRRGLAGVAEHRPDGEPAGRVKSHLDRPSRDWRPIPTGARLARVLEGGRRTLGGRGAEAHPGIIRVFGEESEARLLIAAHQVGERDLGSRVARDEALQQPRIVERGPVPASPRVRVSRIAPPTPIFAINHPQPGLVFP